MWCWFMVVCSHYLVVFIVGLGCASTIVFQRKKKGQFDILFPSFGFRSRVCWRSASSGAKLFLTKKKYSKRTYRTITGMVQARLFFFIEVSLNQRCQLNGDSREYFWVILNPHPELSIVYYFMGFVVVGALI